MCVRVCVCEGVGVCEGGWVDVCVCVCASERASERVLVFLL